MWTNKHAKNSDVSQTQLCTICACFSLKSFKYTWRKALDKETLEFDLIGLRHTPNSVLIYDKHVS